MRSLSGHTLGSYRLIEQVGHGGMAIVYKAFDPALDRYVAIKILPEYLGLDESFSSRFRNEARQVARLSHPYIMPVFAYGEEDGLCYFVMELVAGGTLKEFMVKRLSFEQGVAIVTKLADALGYAHQQGIVHRDIKPDNVLMPAPDRPLLADFGIAKVLENSVAITRSGFLGTPHYMAPEQTLGQPVSPRTDQYALGIVLYELLTGTTPFQAETPQAIALLHVYSSLPFPRERNPLIPRQMEEVVLRALSKHPEHRYPDMTSFVAAIKEVTLTSDGATLVRSSAVPPTEYMERQVHLEPGQVSGLHRRRGIVTGGLTAFALVVAAFVVLLWRATSPSHPARTPTLMPSPTVTPRPYATPRPTTAPVVKLIATLRPQVTPATEDPIIYDRKVIVAHNYSPDAASAETPDGFGHTLYAWIGTCRGSADGHCQKVFFFIDSKYLGTDTLNDSAGISKVASQGTGTIAVTYDKYKSADPLCCPSGPPVTITYHWTGANPMTPSGTPPGH